MKHIFFSALVITGLLAQGQTNSAPSKSDAGKREAALKKPVPVTTLQNLPVNTNRAPQQAPVQRTPASKAPNLSGAPVQIATTLKEVPKQTEFYPVKEYKLDNGLTVFISPNKEVPRIQTLVAVKAGSKFDPAQTTGLAHYLEHMVFKGSADFGTQNWTKEKVVLDSVSALFEAHLNETDEARKKALYHRIDSFSYEASKLAIPNEYDKMVTSLGATGTNAFTSTDMTVYVNDIPSNAMEKWMKLEANRFEKVVLRIFHTELETVYEEFNRNQDNDNVWVYAAINKALMPNHPYGTQTTIGLGEHLKNPSMVNIYKYFDQYYKPNNVAIIIAGDVDPDATFALVQKYFGKWKSAPIPQFVKQPDVEIKQPIVTEVLGPQKENVMLGFRFNGAGTRETLMSKMVDMILANGQAGLIDLDLVQAQKVLNAYSYIDENTDYSIHYMNGEPKQGQKLEEVKDLLLAELDKVKKGDFPDWLLPAIITNLKLQKMKEAESNEGRAYAIMDAFVHNITWNGKLKELNAMSAVTKEQIVAFANKHYGENYAVCYKRKGEPARHKVEKPEITPVFMNKEAESPFKKSFDAMPTAKATPKFIDFDKDIQHTTLANGIVLDYIHNDLNKTFTLDYIFDMGSDNIRKLGLAISYAEFLGTDKYSAAQLQQEFYKLGLSFAVSSGRDRVSVSLRGLEENLLKGVQLFEHILANVKPDEDAYGQLVGNILQERDNAKLNKGRIMSGLSNRAKYGTLNPFTNVLSAKELEETKPEELVALLKDVSSYKHRIFYYGSNELPVVAGVLNKEHKTAAKLKDYPEAITYKEQNIDANTVYFCDYNMKQTEVMLLAKDELFNKGLYTSVFLYNDYYGSGLSSIMFQEIREKMALAYSVYSSFGIPQYANESHYLTSYVGTQSDKLKTALTEMNKLLNNMPDVPQQYEGARQSVVKTLESDWITGDDMYWAWDRAKKRGLNYDIRKQIYEEAQNYKFKDLKTFFDKHVKAKPYAYLVVGNKKDIDFSVLEGLGKVQEIKLEDVFGY
jgi:predicted Zn-dependent peptidase